MTLDTSILVLPNHCVLWRDGKPVWMGPFASPIEDVECDRMTVNPLDYERVKVALIA